MQHGSVRYGLMWIWYSEFATNDRALNHDMLTPSTITQNKRDGLDGATTVKTTHGKMFTAVTTFASLISQESWRND